MFGAFRRCPATLSRNLSSAVAVSRVLRVPLSRTPTTLRVPATRLANASVAGFHHSARWQQIAAQEQEQANASEEAHEPELITEFKELATRGLVHPNIINTITKQMRIETMTDVQTRTINEALSGVDV
jgi:ATP-dependent RNA helicase MSS116